LSYRRCAASNATSGPHRNSSSRPGRAIPEVRIARMLERAWQADRDQGWGIAHHRQSMFATAPAQAQRATRKA